MQGDVEDIDGVVTVSDDGGGGDDPLPPATPASGSGSGSVPPTTPTTTPTSRSGLRPRDIRYDDGLTHIHTHGEGSLRRSKSIDVRSSIKDFRAQNYAPLAKLQKKPSEGF
eukprot:Hpha_TRINITY_DN16881_c0_g1::TRINITY_DN16881_c0_g1_i2::g.149420::m.149420